MRQNHIIINVRTYKSFTYYNNILGDNIGDAQPIIKRAPYTGNKTESPDDRKLFNESWVDIEVYSGAVVQAVQKLLVSVLLQKDELFEISGDRFVPIYYTFRSGNFTDAGVRITYNSIN